MQGGSVSFLSYYFAPARIRLATRVVNIGDVPLGGSYPIRIQSMTNTSTRDIDATVNQAETLAKAGCDYVRITAPGVKEAENLGLIKQKLRSRGIQIPLVADIHFNPKAAETAARLVEKVRINPGNYVVPLVRSGEYSEKDYTAELDKTAEKLSPLLHICNHYGTAIRIGVNHGSLGPRIIGRFGDTPEGMAESAMEYIRICHGLGFHNLVLSLKSSNVRVMVHATRLLVNKMLTEGLVFPLHLGVTEAGDHTDGIIKSAAGIGALLEDGIGDTIRVSLTGDPVNEVPVAKVIAERYNHSQYMAVRPGDITPFDPYTFSRRQSGSAGNIGGSNPVQVIVDKGGIPCLVDEEGSACGAVTREVTHQVIIPQGTARDIRFEALASATKGKPVIIKKRYNTKGLKFMVDAAIDAGSLLIDGLGDALWIKAPQVNELEVTKTAFSILQATRARSSKAEFISCPSCGRTLFDIEEVLSEIKAATGHLKNLKIAVMGCIVNGPGEMADADYGLVGAGNDKLTLYKAKEPVAKNIPVKNAAKSLVELIKTCGDWRDPS